MPPRQARSRRAPAAATGRARDVQAALAAAADPRRVPDLQRFFKTGPGEYAAGDRFRGLKVPQVRAIVRASAPLPAGELARLLASPWHEDRLAGLLLTVRQFARADAAGRRALYEFYLAQARAGRINNWDLVDVTAKDVVGAWLFDRPERAAVLDGLARSPSLWERRIAVLATFHFLGRGRLDDTLRLATALRHDPHDLMHKAVGWALREVGKRDRAVLDRFLAAHAATLPRTLLRYAIEKHPEPARRRWLAARSAAGG